MSTVHKNAKIDDPDWDEQRKKDKRTFLTILTFVFAIAALGFAIYGVDMMLTYDSSYGSSDKIVGGDAYNYMIRATRGVGFILCGVIMSIFATITSD